LTNLNLWTESQNPIDENTGYGVNMMYEESIPRVDFVSWDGSIENRNIKLGFMRVNIKLDGAELRQSVHEFSHVFNVMIGREGKESLYASQGNTLVHSDEGKALRIIQFLPQFTDMKDYREN